jgi:hypothetical protein
MARNDPANLIRVTRRGVLLGLGVALPLLLGCGVLALQLRGVRSELRSAQRLAGPVEQAVRAGDRPDLGRLRARVDEAAAGTHGWLWRVAEHVPYAGADLSAVRRSVAALAELTREALPPLADGALAVKQGGLVRGGQVDLALLARVQADVRAARPVVESTDRTLRGLHAHLVGHQLAQLRATVSRLDDAVVQADAALAEAPALLGVHGDRRYLLAVQNNAEARATGGLIGAVGELMVHDGRLELRRTLTNDQLRSARPPVPDDPAAARTWVAIGSTIAWFDANLTPNVPDAGRNLAELWQAQTAQHVDGVVFVDAVSLQQLVRGPVTLPDGRTVAQDQLVDFICRGEYVDYPDNEARKPLLRVLAGAIFAGATGGGSLSPLVAAAGSGHLLAWMARPDEQALLTGRVMGGTLPADGSAYLQVLSQNFGGDKLDYYLHRTVRVRREHGGLRVTVVLRNDAPLGLPQYVTVRADQPVPPVPYGQAKVGLSVYGGKGATFEGATLDGKPVQVQVDTDHGLGFATVELEVPRGRPVTLSVLLRGPSGLLTYRQQPLVRPDELDLGVPHRVIGR